MGGLCFLLLFVFFQEFTHSVQMSERRFSLAGIAFDIPAASFT